eukprot:TRINITY_DN3307_c0_g1_i1.p1 TRINITY_DN3307_c0_g1~~TRINITY_DN3307_c0_g1_i1.p1  ORF type:complete len:335 (+),score=47.97 TRINITY_DN3307_c0_g1_i1:72-1076(+)
MALASPAFVAGILLWFAISARVSASPVIGVLTQPLLGGSYIEAWYVRWLEGQGARVVPLRYDAPSAEIDNLLGKINAVLLAGGGANISEASDYGRVSAAVFRAAQKEKMPLWATCLGFEQVVLYSSEESWPGPVTAGWDSGDLLLPLNLTEDALVPPATLFNNWPESLLKTAAEQPWTWHSHHKSVSIADFSKRPKLTAFWKVLATNRDRKGLEFVSVVQAKHGRSIFATQFHPEKNAYEFDRPRSAGIAGDLPAHSAGAVEAMNFFAATFVGEARKFRGFRFEESEYWAADIRQFGTKISSSLKGSWLPPHMELYFMPAWEKSPAARSNLFTV